MTRTRKAKIPTPLPEGVEVGKLVRYYSRYGWRIGTLRSVKGNMGSIVGQGYGPDAKAHNAKLIPIADMTKVE